MKIKEITDGTDRIQEVWNLFSQHRDELATDKTLMVLKPDIEKYKALETEGKLISLALYGEDEIVGYSVTFLVHHMHYMELNVAYNDILYIHPDYRRGLWGVKLIKRTEQEAKKRGAQMLIWHGKENTPFCSLMMKLGYRVQDIAFSKEL